jgi:hypothetical protein
MDAGRIFDALNWARTQWPDMALATTGAKGAERLAIRWAQQKGVTLVLARADFDPHGKAAPFRANDELMALEPACCLTLAQSLDAGRASRTHPFGPPWTWRSRRPPAGCSISRSGRAPPRAVRLYPLDLTRPASAGRVFPFG